MTQAETIHQLTQQRDQLLQQAQEEKLRWDAERDLWARTSEALLTKRRAGAEALYSEVRFYLNAQSPIYPRVFHAMGILNHRTITHFMSTQETESKISYYESENKALRTKVRQLDFGVPYANVVATGHGPPEQVNTHGG